ncbi:crotonase/enoyl-CoA hydratase family protein [Comamonas piscis]|uniref:Crotonase/enoyl-CoA hydratase family protein n=1 Tax=Comamonas piscis TaxID=1562974 RepID=A0A7G5ENB9_9BURK|nr:crotonase/enoyl-CoA hydratase family protein [Comamonas piscis]QMV75494.1 crotonase/enoyl-CoA hydratase family protein [Comamonas piscis]WSO34002.1 crotonase/enoyl-CoA hydratase family protein [Comamonas piscis]
MSGSETAELLVETRGPVLIMQLNRPHARNAATLEMAEAMASALDALDSQQELRVGIITGAGGSFCAGMDLKGFLQGKRPSLPGRGFCGLTMRPPAKPLIAAVEGYALAGGFEVALACDLIVAARDAKFGLPEVKRGLAASAGGLLRLPKRLPYHVAMECILTGDMFGAERFAQLGLVNRLTEPGGALDAALALAQTIAANGPLAVAASKQVASQSGEWPLAEMFDRQAEITAPVFSSQDAREGAAAFAEKRPPVWKGA